MVWGGLAAVALLTTALVTARTFRHEFRRFRWDWESREGRAALPLVLLFLVGLAFAALGIGAFAEPAVALLVLALVVFVGGSVAAFPLSTLMQARRARAAAWAEKCPMCLVSGMLRPVKDSLPPRLLCRNQYCNFDFPAALRALPRLGFPTLGVPTSGKTLWMAMMYRELIHTDNYRHLDFNRIDSTLAKEFDDLLTAIYKDRISPSPTLAADTLIPPLTFHCADQDRYGRSELLVNLFDLSGEVTQAAQFGLQTSVILPRSLDSEGFLFFIDPTKSAEEQRRSLVRFQDNLIAMRSKSARRALDTPVAIIITKIDLLETMPFAQKGRPGNRAAAFLGELNRIDPTGRALSLEVMHERSALTARLMREVVWPGSDLVAQVGRTFGGRVMFFPLTPLGINEPGVPLEEKVMIEPYAILDPLLWLITANGFPVVR